MAVRLQRIEESNRADHSHLNVDDECYFLYEYTSGKDYSYSDTNSLINNLKKKRDDGGFHYKAPTIRRCANDLLTAINPNWLSSAVLVPIPPSKAKTDPLYDDRMARVCRLIKSASPNDVREIISQISSKEAAHEGNRLSPGELAKNYEINESDCTGEIKRIGIVDDVLTAGSHFRAVSDKLRKRFPDAQIVGFFVARRVFPA